MADGQDPGHSKAASCKFVKDEVVHKGKWLSLNQITYQDPKGKQRQWEYVARTTKTGPSNADAVCILAIFKRLLQFDCLVLIKQYRPPMKSCTLEFPAGLVDPNESVEEAAVRELKEETGYTAQVKHVSPETCLDPGLESCTLSIVTAEIDGDDEVNIRPKTNQGSDEFIEVVLIPLHNLMERINKLASEGIAVDSRVYSYAIARAQLTKERPLVPDQK